MLRLIKYCFREGKKVNHGEIQAVHDDELVQVLKSLSLYEDFMQGKCKCKVCGKIITTKSLRAIIPSDNEILFSCTDHPYES